MSVGTGIRKLARVSVGERSRKIPLGRSRGRSVVDKVWLKPWGCMKSQASCGEEG